jgi:hypothetical protein
MHFDPSASVARRSPLFRTKVIANFWPRVNEARARYERFMGDHQAHSFDSEHQCWDFWHLPDVYSYLRTDAAKVLGRDLIDDFLTRLETLCLSELGGVSPLSPWMSLHLNGMRHQMHNDSCNGVYGYVYSLTRSMQSFSGGQTCLARELVFDALEPRQPNAWRGYFEVIPPIYDQLVLFDDRLPHMVPVVQGTMNPLEGRVCLTGHLV